MLTSSDQEDSRTAFTMIVTNEQSLQQADAESHYIRDGIVIVPRDAVIPGDAVT